MILGQYHQTNDSMNDKEEEQKISLVGALLPCQHKGCKKHAITLSDYCWEHTEHKDWYKTKVEEHAQKTKSLRKFYMKGADLTGIRLVGIELWRADLRDADLPTARLQEAVLVETKLQKAFLVDAKLQGASLARAELEGAYLLGATLKDVEMLTAEQIGSGVGEEKDKRFSRAQNVYRGLKNHFHAAGMYSDERWAYLKEREMEKRRFFMVGFYGKERLPEGLAKSRWRRIRHLLIHYSHHWREVMQYFFSEAANLLCGYGEQPWKVFVSAVVIVLIFAVVYTVTGQIWLAEDLAARTGASIQGPSLLDSLYFSVVTFTTLGFGDWRPNPTSWVRYLVMLEAFTGAFMMALFVFTFGKSVARR